MAVLNAYFFLVIHEVLNLLNKMSEICHQKSEPSFQCFKALSILKKASHLFGVCVTVGEAAI